MKERKKRPQEIKQETIDRLDSENAIESYRNYILSFKKICRDHGVATYTMKVYIKRKGVFDENRDIRRQHAITIAAIEKYKKLGVGVVTAERLKNSETMVNDYTELMKTVGLDNFDYYVFNQKRRAIVKKVGNFKYKVTNSKSNTTQKEQARDRRAMQKKYGVTLMDHVSRTPVHLLKKYLIEAKNIFEGLSGMTKKDDLLIRDLLRKRVGRIEFALNYEGNKTVPGIYEGCSVEQIKMMKGNLKKPDSYFSGTGGSCHSNDPFIYCTDAGT